MPSEINLNLHPKVANIAGEALALFQSGSIDRGATRLSKAYALSQKVQSSRGPLLPVVAYLGLLNDIPEKTIPDHRGVSGLVMKHTGVCGVLEEWAFERGAGRLKSSDTFHEACRRFCIEGTLSEKMRGDQDQIGIPAQILKETGVAMETPNETMEAIEKCLTAVGNLSVQTAPSQTVRQTPSAQPTVQQGKPAERGASR